MLPNGSRSAIMAGAARQNSARGSVSTATSRWACLLSATDADWLMNGTNDNANSKQRFGGIIHIFTQVSSQAVSSHRSHGHICPRVYNFVHAARRSVEDVS